MNLDYLLRQLQYEEPLIAVYDSPNPEAFSPLVRPEPPKHSCCFSRYPDWKQGRSLWLSGENHGCPGAGVWMLNIRKRDRNSFIRFLADEEGLMDSHQTMGAWLDAQRPYQPKHGQVIVGPYRADHHDEMITLSFIVNPDQLSHLIIGAHYHAHPQDPAPVAAPFGSGCSQLLSQAAGSDHPLAVIGSTDIAMRQFLPPDKLIFTVNPAMAERLSRLDQRSFLAKPFHERLQKSRKKSEQPSSQP